MYTYIYLYILYIYLYIKENIGTPQPPLQIYPLIFIIKFDTKTAFSINCFLYYI